MKSKRNITIFTVAMAMAIVFGGCSDNFFNIQPSGSRVSQDQYDDNLYSAAAHVRGLYSNMIAYGGGHDIFGQKSIDIKTDLISGDMAMTSTAYGWFTSCAQLQEYARTTGLTSYIWSYNYGIIKDCNLVIKQALSKLGANLGEELPDDVRGSLFSSIGQAYAMRGFCYYNLACYYSDFDKNQCVPVYLEDSSAEDAQPFSSITEVYNVADGDFIRAIFYLDGYDRPSKTYVNQDVAKMMRAYLNIRRAQDGFPESKTEYAQIALDLCIEVINDNKFPLLKYDEVLTTGFNSVANRDWMWGMDITVETTTMLATFWGAVDVYTYGYASAGAIKTMDQRLYDRLAQTTDRRKDWFEKLAAFNHRTPTGKFFDSGKVIDGDRIWVNDIVFMRSSEAYLIAAEAAHFMGDMATAQEYLTLLVEQRDPDFAPTIASLTGNELKDQIIFNWRVEMWGEGKAYAAMKRFGYDSSRGSNHFTLKNQDIPNNDRRLSFQIPQSEYDRNPYIN